MNTGRSLAAHPRPRGLCPECGRNVALTTDELIGRHGETRGADGCTQPRTWCPGSYREPSVAHPYLARNPGAHDTGVLRRGAP